MTIAMTIMAKERKGPYIQKQLLYYPVTNACFCTDSYRQFAEGYYLYREGMKWFWDQYTMSPCDRNEITASPLRADIDQLKGLPDAMILNGEADVLRDEGEAYTGFSCLLAYLSVAVTINNKEIDIYDAKWVC